MFIFDKRLDPAQAINFKSSSKAAFGWMPKFGIGATPPPATFPIAAADPVVPPTLGKEKAATTFNAQALLTRVRWDLGATDPICLEGLTTIDIKQAIVTQLYAGLMDITVTFSVRVFEYDPTGQAKKYYACFETGSVGAATPTIGKLLKDGDRELSIEIADDEEVSIQDNSFYPFSIKIVPAAPTIINLAAKVATVITKSWGKTAAK